MRGQAVTIHIENPKIGLESKISRFLTKSGDFGFMPVAFEHAQPSVINITLKSYQNHPFGVIPIWKIYEKKDINM